MGGAPSVTGRGTSCFPRDIGPRSGAPQSSSPDSLIAKERQARLAGRIDEILRSVTPKGMGPTLP
jgi:hypothetical protein